jgi:hypothetical protein
MDKKGKKTIIGSHETDAEKKHRRWGNTEDGITSRAPLQYKVQGVRNTPPPPNYIKLQTLPAEPFTFAGNI